MSEELEALQFIYIDEVTALDAFLADGAHSDSHGSGSSSSSSSSSGGHRLFSVRLAPPSHPFIRGYAVVEHACIGAYPQQAPLVSFSQLRGIDEKRLLAAFESAATAQLGQPMLYQLVYELLQVAESTLVPDTGCQACLEAFSSSSSSAGNDYAGPFVALPCGHFAHDTCLFAAVHQQRGAVAYRLHVHQADALFTSPDTALRCFACRTPLEDDVIKIADGARSRAFAFWGLTEHKEPEAFQPPPVPERSAPSVPTIEQGEEETESCQRRTATKSKGRVVRSQAPTPNVNHLPSARRPRPELAVDEDGAA